MGLVIKNQVEASEKSALQLEARLDDAVRRHHEGVMLAFDVGDLVQFVIAIFERVIADVEQWQREGKAAHGEVVRHDMAEEEWHELYRRLEVLFERTALLIGEIERDGSEVEGKAEFLQAWREIRAVVCFTPAEIAEAVQEARRGEGRSLEEVARGISDQVHPNR